MGEFFFFFLQYHSFSIPFLSPFGFLSVAFYSISCSLSLFFSRYLPVRIKERCFAQEHFCCCCSSPYAEKMEFLSFDNGTIKHPAYREEADSAALTHSTQRRRKRQFFDNANLLSPSYTQNLLAADLTPFTCTPAKVCFVNYDVGKVYSTTLSLLNKTTSPKTFRVMPILPKFANVLSFDYTTPPRISPGLSWEVTLHFRPRENFDFSTALYFKTEKGFFPLSISTSRKTFLLSAHPKSIDFGAVVVGEEQTRHVTLRNRGALSGTVIIGGAFKSLLELKHTNPVNGKKVSFFRIAPQQYKVDVPPFSTFDVSLNFAPLDVVNLETDITLTDKSNPRVTYTIPITGSSTELPVYLTCGKVDFGACFFNEQYWDEVTIVNRTNITAIADFHVPPSLSNVIVVSPSRACVQPNEQYTVQVSFVTNKKLPRFFSSTVECIVRGQTLPLSLIVRADLSERTPQIASNSFDVGKLLLNASQVVEVPVTNDASVVQLVGFENLPLWISASPEVMEIVPRETAVFRLTVEPPQKGRFSQRLRVTNEFGDFQTITVSGQGVSAAFGMVSRTLLLPPCNLGCAVSATTVLYNTGEKAGSFCFALPNSFFRVSPDTGVLEPGESIPIAVIFDAPTEFETIEISQQPVISQRPARSKKDIPAVVVSDSVVKQKRAMYDDWESGTDARCWSKHRLFRLKCDINDGSGDSLFFTVRCCVVKPQTYFEEIPTNLKSPAVDSVSESAPGTRPTPRRTVVPTNEGDQAEHESKHSFEVFLNYEKVPIHCVRLLHCTIANRGTDICFVRPPPTSPLSAFSVLSYAFDGVPSHSDTNLCIAFQPRKYGRFNETLRFDLASPTGNTTNVHVHAQGICSPTQLTISMADSLSVPEKEQLESVSHLLFHCTRKNDSVKKALCFRNVGSSPLAVVINDTVEDAAARVLGSPSRSFLVHPRIFTIQPSSKQTVDVVFAPTDEGFQSQRLCIVASGESRDITLEGRCVNGVVYVLVPHISLRDGTTVAISFTDDVGCRPEFPVSLTFENNESKTIVVGSVGNGPTGEYELLNWEQTRPLTTHPGWNITSSSQVISSGRETQLCIEHVVRDTDGVLTPRTTNSSSALFPLRFTLVLKGEAANECKRRTLFVVCTDE
jgi:hypothetical protein